VSFHSVPVPLPVWVQCSWVQVGVWENLPKGYPCHPLESTPTVMGDDEFLNTVKSEYEQDTLFAIVLKQPDKHKGFMMHNSLLWRTNTCGDEVLCIPWNPKVITMVMDQAHATLGHFGNQRTAEYLQRWYWWPQLLQDIQHFCKTCEPCQRSKGSTKKPTEKLHLLPIPTKPWDSIGMDFLGPFPESKGYNYLWVILC
jgi:hypothetical protein